MEKVFPNFMKISCKVKNSRTERVVYASKVKWLQQERKFIHAKLSEIEIQLYNLHLKITKHLNNGEHVSWLNTLNLMNEESEKHCSNKKIILNKKLKKLVNERGKSIAPTVKFVDNYVRNLSSETFSNKELELLNRGLNFTIKPQKPNIESTVVHIETALKYQPEQIKTEIRRETKSAINIIKNGTTRKSKQGLNQLNTIKALKGKNVHYMKADKGNTLVILDKDDYHKRMEETISECKFQELKRNPLPKMIKTATNAVKMINEIFGVPKYKLAISNPTVPRLYGLPKIHKQGNKMRPIVGNINAPAYNIAKWLVAEYKQYNPPNNLSVKNSFEFVDKIQRIELKDDEILVSFDIVSLYPNVPIPEALDVVNNWLQNLDIPDEKRILYAKLTEMCMDQNELQYNEKFYKLTQGTSMGNPLSCFISNAFIGHLETNLRNTGKLLRKAEPCGRFRTQKFIPQSPPAAMPRLRLRLGEFDVVVSCWDLKCCLLHTEEKAYLPHTHVTP